MIKVKFIGVDGNTIEEYSRISGIEWPEIQKMPIKG